MFERVKGLDDHVAANLRKGIVEFCVLAHLEAGRAYGLDLAGRLKADGLIAGEGTLYPLLSRLKAQQLVDSSWEESEAGRARKYYTLTAEGSQLLQSFRTTWASLRDAVDRTIGSPS